MRKIEKHKFEAVSLLTVENGLLDITIVPASGQPDWIIPSSLIISVDSYQEHIWTYLWQNQEVAVYSLIPRSETPDKIVILEGNTDVHRLGLLTRGALKKQQVRISDVKDIVLSGSYADLNDTGDVLINDTGFHLISTPEDQVVNENNLQPIEQGSVREFPYTYQTVDIKGKAYIVPNLDDLAHHLVDLDS